VRGIAILAACVVAFAGVGGVADARSNDRHKHKQHHGKKHHKRAARPAPKPQPAPDPPAKPASFDGSCEFSGAVTFTPAMTTSPQPIAQHANAPGTCTGTFVDHRGVSHQLDNGPATYRAESAGDAVSCAFGTAAGTGVLAFADGEIAFVMHEYRAAAAPLIRLDGKNGGGAWMPT
jgi:hypothetical protein